MANLVLLVTQGQLKLNPNLRLCNDMCAPLTQRLTQHCKALTCALCIHLHYASTEAQNFITITESQEFTVKEINILDRVTTFDVIG